ncbi:hypothetical protein OHB35_25550 [Streptomyces phaeochromogenes]|uniref:Uncharacterized protein n=1 Tax=Streptomyces phaeochromogenes TaxID=1923 RepID=A0ABZ1HCL4_STRPH|nr:hypothetical protein [Streptomyces phaeochromogenes]WSD16334.1 hypothetical protein OHB35_25550 [Streptomyces phaeochromogenes]
MAAGITVATWALNSRASRLTQRAEFIRNCTNDFYDSQALTSIFMDIDHGRFRYDESILGTEKELDLIRYLDYFNAVGHNWCRGVITIFDIMPTTMAYAALRSWEDPGVRAYLQQIRRWDEERYSASTGFLYFEELAIQIALLCGRIPRGVNRSELLFSASPRRITASRAMGYYSLISLLYCWWWRVTGPATRR